MSLQLSCCNCSHDVSLGVVSHLFLLKDFLRSVTRGNGINIAAIVSVSFPRGSTFVGSIVARELRANCESNTIPVACGLVCLFNRL